MKFTIKAFYNHQLFRALAIPEDQALDDCPDEVRHWIGSQLSEGSIELDTTERWIGFDPETVWRDFQAKGFSIYEVKSDIKVAD